MARVERRPFGSYGLPLRRTLGGEFWRGVLLGFAAITVLLGALRAVGVFHFGRVMMHGAETLEYAAAFSLIFLLIGLQEEFHSRGYGLFTLASGIGFWPAAIVSALFPTSAAAGACLKAAPSSSAASLRRDFRAFPVPLCVSRPAAASACRRSRPSRTGPA